MSRNQKAPLLAFALVALVCGLVLVDTMRGEAEPHPLVVLSPAQLGPAYFLAPKQDPIAPSDQAEPPPEASGPPDLATSATPATPGSTDGAPAPADSQATGPASHGDEVSEVRGTPPADHAGAADPDDALDVGELWPPSSVPGVKIPIVAFTIMDPDDLRPGNGPKDEPSQQPSHPPSAGVDHGAGQGPDQGDSQNGPRDPGHSASPLQQPDPTGTPSGATESAAPSTAP